MVVSYLLSYLTLVVPIIAFLLIGALLWIWNTTKKRTEADLVELFRALSTRAEQHKNSSGGVTLWRRFNELVESYYKQALVQSSVQFWSGIVACGIGFLVIVYTILTPNVMENTARWVSVFVTNAIGALFLKQSIDMRKQTADFLAMLRIDEHEERSMELVNAIKEDHLEAVVKAVLALHFAGVEVPTINWNDILKEPTVLSFRTQDESKAEIDCH